MAAPTVNGNPMEANGLGTSAANPAQQHGRSSLAAKVAENSRKSEDEPSSQRRTSQPQAWKSGVNPITQRSNTPSQTNGASARSSPRNGSQELAPADRPATDRLPCIFNNTVGSHCNITTKVGDSFTGVFAGSHKSSDDYKVLFKMVKKMHHRDGTSSVDQTRDSLEEYVGFGPDHSMVFEASVVARIEISEFQTGVARGNRSNGVSSGFRTDSDISGNLTLRERNLQRWEAPSSQGTDMSLESSGEWDQFKANEERFGLRSDYDENIYTTQIDKKNPLYAMREREAERIAREIEGDVTNNTHMREERGFKDDGLDEEEKYSGVHRNGQEYPPLQSSQPNRYVPPSRRSQVTGTTPTADNGVDPAIISSQIARHEPIEQKKVEQNVEQTLEPKIEPKLELKKESKPEQKETFVIKDGKSSQQLNKAGVTENVETEVLNSFRQFTASEKMKVQDVRRSRASADKAVKLNDLKKFSTNFKLLTPVPKDLIPILAKDEGKQREIVQKAQRIAETSNSSKIANIGPTSQKSQKGLAPARWEGESIVPSTDQLHRSKLRQEPMPQATIAQKDRHHQSRDPVQNRPMRDPLSARLTDTHRQHKAGISGNVPPPLPIQDPRGPKVRANAFPSALSSPQKELSGRGPASVASAKLNVKAIEFKPNPNANAFKPSTANIAISTVASSPRSGTMTRAISPSTTAPKIFGDRTSFGKWEERLDPITSVKPTKPIGTAQEAKDSPQPGGSKGPSGPSLALNGGFNYAYRTHPTWNPPENGDEEMKYTEAFEKLRAEKRTVPNQASPVNPTAQQPQLPFHLQNGAHVVPHVHAPQQIHQLHPQSQHFPPGPHYDDHHMRPSASSSSVYPAPSPRMQNPAMAYPSPMPPHAQLYGQQVQVMMHTAPPMNARQFSNGHQMMAPPGTHLAPMMVHQPSGGGYMPQPVPVPYNQQMIYASPTGPVYGTPSQPPSGYPSPGRPPPMMMHQGSHQGQPQPVFVPQGQYGQPVYPQQQQQQPQQSHMTTMRGGFGSPQPHFAQSPYPQQHYPHQPHRTPSTGYSQPHQGHHQHIPSQQGPPQPIVPADVSDESK